MYVYIHIFIYELSSKLLQGGYIGDSTGEYTALRV